MPEKASILCIDDEAVVRLTLESLLMDDRLQLLFAASGPEGLEMARQVLPDAILLDVMMPGMDGYEVCRRLRSDPNLAEVPIIMITALDSPQARLDGLKAGADDFLTKPFNSLEIQIRIHNILRLNRYRTLVSERARFHWMVDHSQDGYLILSRANLIQYANPRACLLLHLEPEQSQVDFLLQAERHYRLEPADLWEKWAQDLAPAYLVQPETATSPACWLLVSAADIPLGGDNHRIVRLQDVTEQMLADLDMRKFHAVVSHKLRTPVSQIMMSLGLLADLLAQNDRETSLAILETARQGSERLLHEVASILDYIDSPLTPAVAQPLPLSTVAVMAQEAASQHDLAPLTPLLPAELAHRAVRMSPDAMSLILHELVENAVKFHPRRQPQLQVEFAPAGDGRLAILIRDDGVTLNTWQLRSAWQPYFQGEKYFSGEVPGMGLGLPTVAALVWQAGGSVRLNNREPGPGVEVGILLPLEAETE